MYAEPLTFAINGVAKDLTRSFQPLSGGPSLFQLADESFKAEISHQLIKGKRERHFLKLTQRLVSANPFVPAENVENFASVYIVCDNPRQGFTDTQLKYIIDGVCTFFAGSAANKDKFLNNEA